MHIAWPLLVGTLVLCLVAGAAAGFFANVRRQKRLVETTDQAVDARLAEAERQAERVRREKVLEAQDEVHRLRQDLEREMRDRHNELQRIERRLLQREEQLDKKLEAVERGEERALAKEQAAEKKLAAAEEVRVAAEKELQRIAGLTAQQARKELLSQVRREIAQEEAQMLRDSQERIRANARAMAQELISLATQRIAAEHVAESTVAVVALPNDEMKGRIIGREGRNIRTFETLTGVDLIIDDTPEAVIISAFDPVRREIARMALERLVADGRIHPTRIEEMVEKAQQEIGEQMRQWGEKAAFEANVTGLHPDLVQILGRLKFRTSYGQNVLWHSVEVALLAGYMAEELGLDGALARRAGLLHDIGKALTSEQEGSHVQIGIDLARRYHEDPVVLNAILYHHEEAEPTSPISVLVAAADAISAARPGARRENLEAYVHRLERLEELAAQHEGVQRCYAIQSGREIRVLVSPDEVSDTEAALLARQICREIEEQLRYPGQIRVTVIRETRAVEYAR
ncbi:MAG: ribonuclease Y [Firmicutes bacterium]|nr:ribonuclease Y [Bacillota bacterium]